MSEPGSVRCGPHALGRDDVPSGGAGKGAPFLAGAAALRHRGASAAGLMLAAVLAASGTPARAEVLGGTLSTSLYAQKSRLGGNEFALNDQLTARNSLLGTARLDALQLGWNGLSFHTSFTGTNVLTDQSARQTRIRLYRGFLEAQNRGRIRYDMRLGRQWIMAGVSNGVVDGVSLQVGQSHWGDVTGFFGTLGSDHLTRTSRFWTLDKPSESRAFGGRARFSRPLGWLTPSLAVSLGQADRTPHADLVTDEQRLGVNGELRMTRGRSPIPVLEHLRLYGEARQDLIYGRNLNATGGLEYLEGPRNLHGWIEYERRRAELPATSVFASFDIHPVQSLRADLGREIWRHISLDVNGDLITFQGSDHEQGAELMVSGYGYTLGYRLHGGYGGDLSGLILYGHQELGEKLSLDADVNLTRYKYNDAKEVDGAGVDDSETTGVLAANYLLLPTLTLTAQVEGLRNAAFQHDVRFLGLINWRFRSVL